MIKTLNLTKLVTKKLDKLEFNIFPKVVFHLEKFNQMTKSERDGFKKDFHKYVVKTCLKCANLLSSQTVDTTSLSASEDIASVRLS